MARRLLVAILAPSSLNLQATADGRIARKPPAAVIEIYNKNKGKGWGAVARSLGIKPGSPEFKALKAAAAEEEIACGT
jgi:hypothetical protein